MDWTHHLETLQSLCKRMHKLLEMTIYYRYIIIDWL